MIFCQNIILSTNSVSKYMEISLEMSSFRGSYCNMATSFKLTLYTQCCCFSN